ncbi:MAG: class I SAM-dependent methyltransferase, partial [Bacteriovoracaceae bacterium]
GEYVFGKKPADFLAENYHYIPKGGKVLDVGMGEGRNAVYLARKGYKVTGVDISSVAIRKANTLANEYGVKIEAVTSSMQKFKADKESFDCIINFYYVDRKLNKKLVELLKPSGILIYESHTDNQRKVKGSEHYERRYLLRPGELLGLFPRLKILKYQEPLHEENFITSIILQKPE